MLNDPDGPVRRATVQEFLEWFPGVTAQQTRSVLEHATRSLEVA
jgi:hypothetical protein